MGTKNNPAKYDCYANADPNEPMFILLGRDLGAYVLIEAWADARERKGEDPTIVAEARACAAAMKAWATELITICDRCLKASCWQGISYCDDYRTADIMRKTRKELAKLGRESSDYWQ